MLLCVVRDAVFFSLGGGVVVVVERSREEGERRSRGRGGKGAGGREGGNEEGVGGELPYFFSFVTLLQDEFCTAAKTFSPDTCVSLPRCLSFFMSPICFR